VEHDSEDWSAQVTRTVGERVAYYRQRATGADGRKLTAQDLADRCTALGLPTGRPAIAKLEKGIRQTVSVAELLVLAEALGVPALLLLFPVGQLPAVDVLPDRKVSPWDACRWFNGGGLIDASGMDPDSPIALWADHESLLGRIARNRLQARHIMNDAAEQAHAGGVNMDAEMADRLVELARETAGVLVEREILPDLRTLRRLRVRMRQLGLTPPGVDHETALDLDEEAGDGVD
jgi:transcriptional regulator with XRE-family HTH domain